MTRSRLLLAVGLSLVALFALTAGANAKPVQGNAPDLVVTKVSKPPASKIVGSKLKLVVTVKNKGGGAAGKSKLGIYLGKGNKHVKKDKRLKRVKVKPLAVGKKKKLKLQVVLPAKSVTGKYRLFACSDDTKKVAESKESNCRGTRKFTLAPVPVPVPAVPAFTATNPIEWGFVQDAARKDVEAGTPITATLRAANGLAGASGYTQAAVAPSPFTAGTTIAITPDEGDDGAAAVALPFAFPFGGINETSVSVGTNGWVSFGAPAFDYWDDSQPDYYQGGAALVGDYYRGIMPYWADLDIESGDGGTIKEVIAADGKSVAIQWDVGQHSPSGEPPRVFQLVLFADGSFRFDYPGANLPGGEKSLVGFSLGEGPSSATVVSSEGTTVPASSLLFTPNPVRAETATVAGQLSTTLPFGSTLLSADPGCVLALAPTAFENGLVNCPAAGILPGEQITRQVTFATPPNFPGETGPPNFRFTGTYAAGPFNLADTDEIPTRSNNLAANAIELNAKPSKPNPPKAGFATEFEVDLFSKSGPLDEPTATFSLTANSTLTGIAISGKALPCGPITGGQVTCKLASGGTGGTVVVTLVPSAAALGSPLTLAVSASALNAPTASDSVTTSAVIAGP